MSNEIYNTMSMFNTKLEIRPYTMKELAVIYQITPRSFATWIKKFEGQVGKKQGRYFSVHQVKVIIEKLGIPGTIGE
jgi:hypothetical protein